MHKAKLANIILGAEKIPPGEWFLECDQEIRL